MKHETQGYNECQLTTIAMLVDKPIARIRQEALEVVYSIRGIRYKSWYNSWESYTQFWTIVNTLLDRYGFNLHPTLITSTLESHSSPISELSMDLLSKKGQLTVIEGKVAHAVAFENGIIYDGGKQGPLSYTEWREVLIMNPQRFIIIRKRL